MGLLSDEQFKSLVENLPAILTAGAAFLGACGGVIVGVMANFRSQANGRKIDRVEQAVNGATEKKVAAALITGHAAGVESERQRSEMV